MISDFIILEGPALIVGTALIKALLSRHLRRVYDIGFQRTDGLHHPAFAPLIPPPEPALLAVFGLTHSALAPLLLMSFRTLFHALSPSQHKKAFQALVAFDFFFLVFRALNAILLAFYALPVFLKIPETWTLHDAVIFKLD